MHIHPNPYQVTPVKYYRHHLSPGYDFRGHRHGTVELNIMLRGEMEITCGEGVVHAGQNEVLLIPSGAFHRNRVLGEQEAELLEVRFEPIESIMQKDFSVYHLSEDMKVLAKLFCREMDENATVIDGDCHRIEENARMLLCVFLQNVLREPERFFLVEEESAALYRSAVLFMKQHVREKLTVDRIARHTGVCRTTLKNVFSHYTGQGCIAYFEEMKLNMAKDYLLSGKTCAETAMEMGFSSQAHFSKRFKSLFGISPSEVKGRKIKG